MNTVKELLREQLPIFGGLFAAGLLALYYQSGGVAPSFSTTFPVAGVELSIVHLLLMGFITGYIMGLVGEASGLLALPYSMTVMGFSGVSVSPSMLIVTFLNPIGALIGYFRSGQFNLDLAKWVCIGAICGSVIGPFIRVFLLEDPDTFKALTGFCLTILSVYLFVQITPWYINRNARQKNFDEKCKTFLKERRAAGLTPRRLPEDFRIETLKSSNGRLTISYWGEEQTLNIPAMLITGFLVGILASAMGIGGGFLLVPILASFFALPMYVLVAATIPFVIVLSVTGLFSYVVTVPLITGEIAGPDWGFGLLVASGALFGAWVASKTQMFISEKVLKPILGFFTAIVGIMYVINMFWSLPFEI